MSDIIDDKSEHVVPFILDRLHAHRDKWQAKSHSTTTPSPFFVGLNGIQGAGKTTLVSLLSRTLQQPPHSIPTLVISIDDFYLPHDRQLALAQSHPQNALVQHRGQPGTHDVPLMIEVFSALSNRQPTKIPGYNKSAFNGQGDRADSSIFETVNKSGDPPIELVIFEGWCVGFRPLPDEAVEKKWSAALDLAENGKSEETILWKHRLEHLLFVNRALKDYDKITDMLDAFVQLDAEDTKFVYGWRQEQERKLREEKGMGMSEEEVVRFVDGYYPSYELYTETLRAGVLKGQKGRQMRLILGEDRKVKHVETI